ncbi:autotransporter secretion inner membrane protein TamB [Roseiarcus fermentans]|uniref:Autotransporter secretion inner membrane protein TamB n=1 Tax=Roseiarcus fermentans TaxID=1473586 RepID=A0A366EYA1_9HYPH|nr:translocation/assembly module TamB domain-containing protein [Roseiarcus fermentans]RBP07372.1 autotransporter secretion inner membrane protein TamB [Roseiarcus fermentans]
MTPFVRALLALVLLLAAPARADEADKGVLANLISRALSSPSLTVSVGAVQGVLSSDSTISDIVLSDRDGPWLKIDKARLIWSRLALLSRRLEVDRLTIDHMQVLRRPLPSDTPPPPQTGAPQPILPELPVKVVVKDFAIDELSLGEPVAGVAARLAIDGKATLGPPSEGLDLSLHARRLDAGGEMKTLLTYVPSTDRLTVSVNSAEPAGGIFAHLANLPGLPPAKFSFEGAGPLDNFDAKLDFAAGGDVWARGDVTVARQGAARKLTLELAAQLAGMTPPVVRPVFAGQTTLEGDVLFNDDSSIATPGLHLVSSNARLDIEGTRRADGALDIRVHAGAIPGSSEIGKLDLNATIAGPASSPSIDGRFDAGAIRVAEGTLERVTAAFDAHPSGALTETATRILFSVQGDVKGLVPADKALADALGRDFALTARGSAGVGGEIAFDTLDLVAPKFEAQYSGLASSQKMHGKLKATIEDLGRFSGLVGGRLAGEARLAADLDGAPGYGLVTATLDARATRLVTPYSALDKVLGGQLAVTGVARTTPGGGFGFSNLEAAGRNGSAVLDGDVRKGKADLTATVDIPQARALDPRVDAKAALVARLTGSLDDLGAELKAQLGVGRLLDRKTTGVTLTASASHLLGLLEAKASLAGDVDGQPLQGSGHVVKRADGGWSVDDLGLSLASARLAGDVNIGGDRLANGELTFEAKNLDDLSPILLMKLGGGLKARITATVADGRQAIAIVADSKAMSVGDNRLEGLAVDMTVADVWAGRGVAGSAKLLRAQFAGESVADLRIGAKAAGDASDLDVAGVVRGLVVKARGRLTGGAPIRLDLAALSAEGHGRRIALAGPAQIAYGAGGLDIRDFALAVDSGRIAVNGRVGDTLDLRATAAAVPLAALDLVSPGLGLSGAADGEATIRGTRDSPAGDWRVHVRQVSAAQIRAAGLPALDLTGSGRLGQGRTSVDVTASAGAANSVRVTGSAPLAADGALDLRIDGRLDAGLANVVLSTSGRSVGGAVTTALSVRGTIAKPNLTGTVTLANGAVRDDQTGFKLTAVSARLTASGDTIRIDSLTGTTANGGTIGASGQVKVDPAAGFPGTIHVVGHRAALVDNAIVAATADLTLEIAGRLAQSPTISGRIAILSMDINVPGSLGGASAPIPGTKHLNPTPTARALLARAAKASAPGNGPAFDATLAVTVSAPNRVFLRGRGLNAEFGGDLHVAGAARNPQITGGFDLLRGTLALVGQQLTFTRGKVTFHGGVIPDVDLVAETSAADVTARIEVSGPANQPAFTITSTPSLPQDEILARILFQKPSGSLSAFQALELANAAATLSGRGDMLDPLRRSLGLTNLGVGTGSGGLLGLGRAINDRISVDVTTGVTPQQNGVNVNLDLTRHIRLQAGVDASGGTDVGVGAGWEWK